MNDFIKENWKLLMIYWLIMPVFWTLAPISMLLGFAGFFFWHFYFGQKVRRRFKNYESLSGFDKVCLQLLFPFFIGIVSMILLASLSSSLNLHLYDSIHF